MTSTRISLHCGKTFHPASTRGGEKRLARDIAEHREKCPSCIAYKQRIQDAQKARWMNMLNQPQATNPS